MKDLKNKIDILEISGEEQDELNCIWQQIEYLNDDKESTSVKFLQLKGQLKRARQRKLRRVYASVSSVAAVLFIIFLAYNFKYNENNIAQTVSFDYKETGVSALNTEVTLLVNGHQYGLTTKSASLSLQDTIISVLNGDGKKVSNVASNEMLTVKVPVGHQFEMTLSDGTKVKLNSDSELTYPAKFEGKNRCVKIVGEAYFDVKRNENMPFIVSVDGKYDVKVLGTSFNIDSYSGSNVSRTTLVSGKVKVLFAGSDNEVDLVPSEQLVYDNMKCVEVKKVNTESCTSWMEKRFVFDNESLSEIARKMSRCYGMDVFVGENYRDYSFSGRVSYNRGIAYFIKVLKDTEGIQCEFKNGTLLIGVKN